MWLSKSNDCLMIYLLKRVTFICDSSVLLFRRRVDLSETINEKSCMAYYLTSLLLFFGFILSIHSQPCSEVNIVLTTQEAVDAFRANYPGCTTIQGSLTIGSQSSEGEIINLDSLSHLTSVEVDLIIQYTSLSNLDGLDALTHVGRFFRVIDNPVLVNLSGLDSFSSLYTLSIEENSNLLSLEGLENIDSVNAIHLTYNDNIETIEHLRSLEYAKSLRFFGCPQLSFSVTEPIPLVEVGGYLSVLNCYSSSDLTIFGNLTRIGRGIELRNNSLSSLNGLEQLDSCGLLEIIETAVMNVDALSNLGYLGEIHIDNNPLLTDFTGLDHVTAIHGNVSLGLNSILQDSILRSVSVIEGDLVLSGNSFQLLDLSEVLGVAGNMELKHNDVLVDLEFLSHFDSIGGGLTIEDMRELQTLAGFPFGEELNGNLKLFNNPVLEEIEPIPSLGRINGDLDIERNFQLMSLQGLDSLVTIAGVFSVVNNSSLLDFQNLSKLSLIGDRIFIKDNYNLSSLNGLGSVAVELLQPTTIERAIRIQNNPLLSLCAVRSFCDLVNHPDVTTFFGGNDEGCNNLEEINDSCEDHSFGGYVFYDLNGNGIFDETEFGVDGAQVLVLPEEAVLYTNSDGFYKWLADTSVDYSISFLSGPTDQWQTDPDTIYTFNFQQNQEDNYSKNFSITPTEPYHAGQISLTSNPARCNTDVPFLIGYGNRGTSSERGEVQLSYDPAVRFIESTPAPSSIDTVNRVLIWTYSELLPFQFRSIELVLAMPDETNTGLLMNFDTELTREEDGISTLLDSNLYQEVVLCSYDPNDKLVSPRGVQEENYTIHDQIFTYTIRFQNTGNAEAIDINIFDTISPLLDLESFRVLNSSFPVQTSIQERAVRFYFENIWLPDSLSNEPASHGFVTYVISPLPNLDDFSVISNTAFIVFDFNPAVITNTTQNTMVSMIPTSASNFTSRQTIEMFPNPSENYIKILNPNVPAFTTGIIYNSRGIQVLSFSESLIDVSNLTKGTYFITLRSKGNIYHGKFIKL